MLSLLLFASVVAAGSYKPLDPSKNVIVQMFEWPWDSIASECTSHLGPAGYGYVQTSTPHEHINTPEWWADYQVVSYNITSRRGNRQQFANMVSTCKKAGVGIIIDAVTNHMTGGSAQGKGIGGSPYSKYNYPLFKPKNFHKCGGTVALDITNYGNRYNTQFCEESELADLAQEQDYVRDTIAAYLTDLQSLGVAGFRVDSGVQQPASNLSDIFAMLPKDYYATFETEPGPTDAVKSSEYWGIGATMAFTATGDLKSKFSSGIAELVTPRPLSPTWSATYYPKSDHANWFVTNHDMERNGGSLTATSANNAYVLANIFILAFNYGAPEVFSGFDLNGDIDHGQPQDSKGMTKAVACGSNGWRCEHRWYAIANMVGFHNKAAGCALANVQKGSGQQIAFSRSSTGFVAINNDASTWSKTFQTGLAAGSYCCIIHNANTTSCTEKITVNSSGQATLSVPAHDAIAFYKH